jgi:hypothetical protein
MATPTNLPAAFVAGDVLEASQLNGLRGAFRVLQQVEGAANTQIGSTSATYVTTGLSATITPQATSSKIRVDVGVPGSTDTAGGQLGFRLVRTIGGVDTVFGTFTYALYNSAGSSYGQFATPIVFSPATTSAVTVTLQFARTGGGGTVYTNVGNTVSNIILQEISA